MTRGQRTVVASLVVALFLTLQHSEAWLSNNIAKSSRFASSTLQVLPEGYQEFGEHIVRRAGESVGIQNDDDMTVEWKTGKIVVTVKGSVYVSNPDDSTDSDDEGQTAEPAQGVDVTKLAKAINSYLDDDGIGLAIAEAHEIEVTTPGASDELSGVMFEAYRGFEVIAQQQDPKSNKIKQIQGKLVERNDEFTVVNIKGRMKKMKNETVLSVKLPKAKKEKGVK